MSSEYLDIATVILIYASFMVPFIVNLTEAIVKITKKIIQRRRGNVYEIKETIVNASAFNKRDN
jgi:hypothetical protein